ncbi:MAG: hypothetical protein AAF899_18610, partial [Pseudomonadota bacterium]
GAIAILRALVQAEPENLETSRALAVSLSGLGSARLRLGDREGARVALEQGLQGARALLQSDPRNPLYEGDLVAALVRLSSAVEPARGRALLNEARRRTARLVEGDAAIAALAAEPGPTAE